MRRRLKSFLPYVFLLCRVHKWNVRTGCQRWWVFWLETANIRHRLECCAALPRRNRPTLQAHWNTVKIKLPPHRQTKKKHSANSNLVRKQQATLNAFRDVASKSDESCLSPLKRNKGVLLICLHGPLANGYDRRPAAEVTKIRTEKREKKKKLGEAK